MHVNEQRAVFQTQKCFVMNEESEVESEQSLLGSFVIFLILSYFISFLSSFFLLPVHSFCLHLFPSFNKSVSWKNSLFHLFRLWECLIMDISSKKERKGAKE